MQKKTEKDILMCNISARLYKEDYDKLVRETSRKNMTVGRLVRDIVQERSRKDGKKTG